MARVARGWLVEFAEEGVERIEGAGCDARTGAGVRAQPHRRCLATASQPLSLFEARPTWSGETTLEAVRAALGDCTRCRLCEQRTQIVFGDGNPHAELMFVGEGPGAEEDRTGFRSSAAPASC